MREAISKFAPKSLIEWLMLVAVMALLIALILPTVQWASSGTIEIPVRVVVFDAKSARPISGAKVAIFRAPPACHRGL